jgi:hypothetical protein
LEAVEARQLQINHEHVGRLGAEDKQGAFGIFDHRDDRPALGELPRENVSRRVVVFDHENLDRCEGRRSTVQMSPTSGRASLTWADSSRGRLPGEEVAAAAMTALRALAIIAVVVGMFYWLLP